MLFEQGREQDLREFADASGVSYFAYRVAWMSATMGDWTRRLRLCAVWQMLEMTPQRDASPTYYANTDRLQRPSRFSKRSQAQVK